MTIQQLKSRLDTLAKHYYEIDTVMNNSPYLLACENMFNKADRSLKEQHFVEYTNTPILVSKLLSLHNILGIMNRTLEMYYMYMYPIADVNNGEFFTHKPRGWSPDYWADYLGSHAHIVSNHIHDINEQIDRMFELGFTDNPLFKHAAMFQQEAVSNVINITRPYSIKKLLEHKPIRQISNN